MWTRIYSSVNGISKLLSFYFKVGYLVGSCYFVQSYSFCLLIDVFRPLTFNCYLFAIFPCIFSFFLLFRPSFALNILTCITELSIHLVIGWISNHRHTLLYCASQIMCILWQPCVKQVYQWHFPAGFATLDLCIKFW